MNTLKAHHLSKQFKTRQVIKDISLQLQSGEIVGLLGPNGAGKTTCFYMIVGLLPCDTGQVMINDKDITTLPIDTRARLGLGYLPQEPSVFRKLSVADNIMAILQLRTDLKKKERQQKLDQLLEEFHLHQLHDQVGMSLSGGERRRLEMARALAFSPRFMLLDEPFAGVDPISVVDIKQIITQVSRHNIGILITDHNVRETLDICQRAYIVNEGQIICEGTPQDILKNPKVRTVYLGEEFMM